MARASANWPHQIADGRPLDFANIAWQTPSATQLQTLVVEAADEDVWRRNICLFVIPEHLRTRCWAILALEVEAMTSGSAMKPFAREILEFTSFKQVPVPRQCRFELTVSPPGRPDLSHAAEPDTVLAGSSSAERNTKHAPPIARVNLGDERSAMIFLNLGRRRISEMLGTESATDSASDGAVQPLASDDLVRRFLARFPEYPLLRVLLEPGEGVWLPCKDVICDVDRTGKEDLDVWLVLKDEG